MVMRKQEVCRALYSLEESSHFWVGLAVKELPPKILPVGRVLALIGGIWALARIDFDIISYGVYAAIIGAILALVGSVAVLKEK